MALSKGPMAGQMPTFTQAPAAAAPLQQLEPSAAAKFQNAALKFGANKALDMAMPGLGTVGGEFAQAVMPAFFETGGEVEAQLRSKGLDDESIAWYMQNWKKNRERGGRSYNNGGTIAPDLQPELSELSKRVKPSGQLSLPKSFIQYDMAPIMGYLPGPLGMKDMTDMAKANGAGKLAGIEYKRQGGKVPTQHVSMKFHGPMAPKPSGE